ncbi:MAG TPA: PH domain-containing protein [Arenimonas sp.]|uniref:PH domain-containing protein n=1 Tax=Arenimonas sp. TaxID=1872635 RepID=UPI002D7E7315|nr:PH domain-containing protein [Arenimonas sp.]HEU0154102.1 PH domain-containing protein [Arenimonas sp.]
MTTPSEGVVAGGDERRLHPWSWLFVLIQQLKSFALPLVVLLFTGRGNSWELWGLVGAGVLVLVSLAQYFTYRFRVDGEGIVIRSGLLQKSLRHIPFQRIHNVALHQTLLHRVFKVAEVRLESAGGMKAEGEMRVLSLADAHALEELVRSHGRDAPRAPLPGDAAPEAATHTLLALPTSEVVRLGLISNRGMLMVAAVIGVIAQSGGEMFGDGIEYVADHAADWSRAYALGVAGTVLALAAMLVFALVALRLLSVVLALLQYHDFTLTETGRRLSAQRGLLTRVRANMPRSRIQAWSLRESLTHRWLGRQGLRVDSASIEAVNDQRSLRDLAPVATPEAMVALIRHLLPGHAWPLAQWRPLHPKAWRRQFTIPALFALALAGGLTWLNGPWGLLALALLPVFALRAVVWARYAAYSLEGGLVAVREGWLDKSWRFAEVRKLQSLRLAQSPFDRRHGMASLLMDTVGASPFEPPLRVRYLPEAEARALRDQLAAAMDAAATPARMPA